MMVVMMMIRTQDVFGMRSGQAKNSTALAMGEIIKGWGSAALDVP